MSSKELTPQEFERAYLNRGEGQGPRKDIESVLSPDCMSRLWQTDEGLLKRVEAFYHRAFNEVTHGIPDSVSKKNPSTIRLLSHLKKFKKEQVGWGDFKRDEKGGQTIVVRPDGQPRKSRYIAVCPPEMEMPPKGLSDLLRLADESVLLALRPLPTTQRFAAFTVITGLTNLYDGTLIRNIEKSGTPLIAWISLAEHLTHNRYLARTAELLDEEGVERVDQYENGLKKIERNQRMCYALDSFLFPDMPAQSEPETQARTRFHNSTLLTQLSLREAGEEGITELLERTLEVE